MWSVLFVWEIGETFQLFLKEIEQFICIPLCESSKGSEEITIITFINDSIL